MLLMRLIICIFSLVYHLYLWWSRCIAWALLYVFYIVNVVNTLLRRRGRNGPLDVFVVGGGIAGCLAARDIADRGFSNGLRLKVTLVDPKTYFEYTPSVLRAIVDLREASTILMPYAASGLPSAGVQVRQACVTRVDPTAKTIQYTDAVGHYECGFDYALLSHGVPYAESSIRDWTSQTVEDRRCALEAENTLMTNAQCIVLAGGGATGVELAAELATGLRPLEGGRTRRLVLVCSADRLLHCSPPFAGRYVLRWLERRGVEVILGDSVQDVAASPTGPKKTVLQLRSGRQLECDVYRLCAMRNGDGLDGLPSSKNGVLVNEFLQVKGQGTVFAAGDAVEPLQVCGYGCARCGKSAYLAENTACVAAKNMVRVIKGRQQDLLRFPGTAARRLPTMESVSLGRWDGVLILNNLVVPGVASALVKGFIKYSKMDDLHGGLVGRVLWVILDTVSPYIGRLVPVYEPELKPQNG